MEVASLTAFRYHPEKFYQWLRPLANKMFTAEPNEAHLALAKLEANQRISTVITQNIDTLHQKAGSENILEVHGTFETLSCIACYRQIQTTEDILSSLIEEGKVPRCQKCGAVLKPDVVLFEEQLPAKTWRKAKMCSQSCNYMLVLGSSLTVTPVSSLPLEALASGAPLIIINQSKTYLDDRAEVVIHDDVANILPAITQKVLYG
jgi:NAD-dependent deacetylase